MKIRWKLLGLLVATALLPLALVTGYSQVRGRQLGLELAAETREAVIAGAERELQQLVDSSSGLFWQRGEALSLAVRTQVREAERLLASEAPSSEHPVVAAAGFGSAASDAFETVLSAEYLAFEAGGAVVRQVPVSYEAQAFHLAPDADAERAEGQLRQLASMIDLYQAIHAELGEHLVWQYIGLESGLHLSYPAHGGYPASYDPRERAWYELAKASDEPRWIEPLVDASTQQVVVPIAAPLRDAAGEVIGVTGVDVALIDLLETVYLPEDWSRTPGAGESPAQALLENEAAQVLVCILREPPDSDEPGLFLWAYQGYETAGASWDQPLEQAWFEADDPLQQRTLIADIVTERQRLLAEQDPCVSTVRRLTYEGQEHFWAHRQFEKYPEVVVAVLVPYDLIVAQAEVAEQRFRAHIFRQMGLALGVVTLLALGVLIAALVVSREFTLPIGKLASAAQRVARGDLQARADVRRGDELGDLAEAFNDMLPKLQDRLRMRQSLGLAMEVQQNLLPGRAPTIPGVDIAGHSLYCDETGGDYYDFIEIEPLEQHAVLAAVGDVTGHGVAAALLMTTARALLRSRSALPGELAQVVTDINRQLSHDTPQGRFMTLFLLLVDQEHQQLCWVSAGHDPAFCYDPVADQFEELSGEDIPLGIDDDWEYRQRRQGFPEPGNVIVIGTDGIWEARNAAGEMYGKDRLREAIRRHAGLPAEELSRALSADVYEFLGDRQHQDDATQVVLKFVAPAT